MHWEDPEGSGGEGGGGGIGMGNTCKPMAVSFQCMTKSTIKKKKNELNFTEQVKKNGVLFLKSFKYITFLFRNIIINCIKKKLQTDFINTMSFENPSNNLSFCSISTNGFEECF